MGTVFIGLKWHISFCILSVLHVSSLSSALRWIFVGAMVYSFVRDAVVLYLRTTPVPEVDDSDDDDALDEAKVEVAAVVVKVALELLTLLLLIFCFDDTVDDEVTYCGLVVLMLLELLLALLKKLEFVVFWFCVDVVVAPLLELLLLLINVFCTLSFKVFSN